MIKAARVILLCYIARSILAHPCDPEAAVACPFEGGPSLGPCLRNPSKHEAPIEISSDCQAFLDLHTSCQTNLESGTCGGTAYTDDAILCLTQWLNPADLTEECKGALPQTEKKEERVLDDAAQAKRDKRKRARAKAAEEVRKLNEQNAGSSSEQKPRKKASSTTTKKAKKKSSSSTTLDYEDL